MMTYWRTILARAPLPMLALAASYGVYSFASLFVPLAVAIIQAAAFELTYIGLAVTRGLSADDRRRATAISVGAVAASIIYNTLAGWFHRQPDLLSAASPIAWLMLAILHGAPLAWVAFLVADLLLHSNAKPALETLPERLETPIDPDVDTAATFAATAQEQADHDLTLDELLSGMLEPLEEPPALSIIQAPRYSCPHCGQALASKQAVGAAVKNGYCLGCKEVRKAG